MKKNGKIILCLPVLLAFLAAPPAARAITRCEVLEDAQSWVDARVAYGWGPGAEYCPSPYYCDPMRGGECYRPDCSGFVSATWWLPGPGHTTYSFAGGPWDDGVSVFTDIRGGDQRPISRPRKIPPVLFVRHLITIRAESPFGCDRNRRKDPDASFNVWSSCGGQTRNPFISATSTEL